MIVTPLAACLMLMSWIIGRENLSNWLSVLVSIPVIYTISIESIAVQMAQSSRGGATIHLLRQ